MIIEIAVVDSHNQSTLRVPNEAVAQEIYTKTLKYMSRLSSKAWKVEAKRLSKNGELPTRIEEVPIPLLDYSYVAPLAYPSEEEEETVVKVPQEDLGPSSSPDEIQANTYDVEEDDVLSEEEIKEMIDRYNTSMNSPVKAHYRSHAPKPTSIRTMPIDRPSVLAYPCDCGSVVYAKASDGDSIKCNVCNKTVTVKSEDFYRVSANCTECDNGIVMYAHKSFRINNEMFTARCFNPQCRHDNYISFSEERQEYTNDK